MQGVRWMELTLAGQQPRTCRHAAPISWNIATVRKPARTSSFAEGTYNPVGQMGDPKVMALFGSEELDAFQYDTLEADMDKCTDFDIIPDYTKLHEIFSAAVREKA